MIKEIQKRSVFSDGQGQIRHFVEVQILEAIEIDYIDESEVLSQQTIVSMWTRIPSSFCLWS